MTDDRPRFDLPPATRIGRVALRVGSLDRVLPFYRALGFEAVRDAGTARLAADGTDLVVLTEVPDAPERPSGAAGLFHFAVRVPSREALADALGRIRDAGLRLTGASDHLVSEALYLRDPEGNGVEVYRDLPREDWPVTDDGLIDIGSVALDLDSLAAAATGTERFPAGTDVGHVHIEVTDLPRARAFYVDEVGFAAQAPDHRDEAAFVAAGDYHHHLGLNVWHGRTDPAGGTRGLAWYELVVPDRETRDRLGTRLDATRVTRDGDDLVVTDPDGIAFRVTVE